MVSAEEMRDVLVHEVAHIRRRDHLLVLLQELARALYWPIVTVHGLIRELGQEHTVLLSTHILSEVEMTCDQAIIINRGRVAAAGRLSDLRPKGQTLEEMFVRLVESEEPVAV